MALVCVGLNNIYTRRSWSLPSEVGKLGRPAVGLASGEEASLPITAYTFYAPSCS